MYLIIKNSCCANYFRPCFRNSNVDKLKQRKEIKGILTQRVAERNTFCKSFSITEDTLPSRSFVVATRRIMVY